MPSMASVMPEGGPIDGSLPSDEESGFGSRISLLWLVPVLRRGGKEILTPERLPRLPSRHDAAQLDDIAHDLLASRKGKLGKVVWDRCRFKYSCCIVLACFWGALSSVGKPLLVKIVVNAVQKAEFKGSLIAIGLFFAANIIDVMLQTWTQLLADDLATEIFSWMSSMIMKKSQRLAPAQGGNEVGLISDMNRNLPTAGFMGLMPGVIVSLIGGLVMLVLLIGWQGAVGWVLMLMLGYISVALSAKSQKFAKGHLEAADSRLKITRQMIEGIKAVKFLCWEQSFLDAIDKARRHECMWIRMFRTAMVVATTIGRTSILLAAAGCFAILASTVDELSSEDVFSALAVFLGLRMPMLTLPWSIMMIVQLRINLSRIQAYLHLPEATPLEQISSTDISKDPSLKNTLVVFKGASFRWPGSDAACLRNLTFTLNKGRMVAVVGAVGSSKSSLLTAILGGMEHLISLSMEHDSRADGGGGGGSALIAAGALDTLSYVPQKSIVVSGTVLENIVMSHPMDRPHLDFVFAATCMQHDLTLLPHGENTDIGERGVTLSGGQRARLAIARALYARPKVLVFDDPLAAVCVCDVLLCM
jgi:ABC-type multidrug transport system fused ATPase/permease subunit